MLNHEGREGQTGSAGINHGWTQIDTNSGGRAFNAKTQRCKGAKKGLTGGNGNEVEGNIEHRTSNSEHRREKAGHKRRGGKLIAEIAFNEWTAEQHLRHLDFMRE